jgi:MarR family transcriptional regulator, organic hydroperoxide resistance regulator
MSHAIDVVERRGRRSNAKKKSFPASELFDERGRTVPWMARTVHRLYDVHSQKILDRENISISHWYYLRVLAARGDLNQLELSKRVGIASTTAVPALDSMEKRGLLKRTPDPKDRRKYYVRLTDEGKRLVDQLLPELIDMIASTLEGITREELRTLWNVLHKIEDNLNSMANGNAIVD